MNVDDVASQDILGDGLLAIFQRQTELMEKYAGIDKAFGLANLHKWPPPSPLNLDNYAVQCLIKDFAWRVTEELTESTQALQEHAEIFSHAKEEAVDALHFLVELAIIAGIPPEFVRRHPDSGVDGLEELIATGPALGGPDSNAYAVIQEIGNAMNLLKNKPWKQTQMMTDVPRFNTYIAAAFMAFGRFCASIGMDRNQVLDFYFRKSEVNKFRQRSQY